MAWFAATMAAAGMVGGAVFSGDQARRNNTLVSKQARRNQEALNENIKRARMAFFDQQRAASGAFQKGQGNASAQIFGGGASGHSLNRLLAEQSNDFVKDDEARKTALKQSIENFELQKKNISTQATQQQTNVTSAMIGGAQQGMALGGAIGGAVEGAYGSMKDAQTASEIEQKLAAGNVDDMTKAQGMALSAGVSPSMLRNYPSISTQPFLQSLATQGVGQQIGNIGVQSAAFGMNQASFLANQSMNSLQSMMPTVSQLGGGFFGGGIR